MAKPSSALVQIAEENQEDVVAENRIVVVKKKRAAARRPPTSPLKTEEESVIVRADSRYGRRDRGHNRYFDKTPRFSGKPPEIGAPQYLLPPPRSEYETVFGSSTREDWGKAMGTIPKININGGPGAYEIVSNLSLRSDMPRARDFKFARSTRPDMNMKTLSPGPSAYKLEGMFKSGRDYPGKLKPGFNLDHRKPLITSATDAMYHPALRRGPSCTMASRRTPSVLRRAQLRNSPAPHDYEVVEALRVLHKPPGGNFGKGAARFKGVDKVAVLMKKLEDAEYMAGWILDLPSVSSDATTTNTKKNDT